MNGVEAALPQIQRNTPQCGRAAPRRCVRASAVSEPRGPWVAVPACDAETLALVEQEIERTGDGFERKRRTRRAFWRNPDRSLSVVGAGLDEKSRSPFAPTKESSDVYWALLRRMKASGWWVGQSRRHRKEFRRLRHEHHQGARARLRVRTELHPFGCHLNFYMDHNASHPHGPRYAHTVDRPTDRLYRLTQRHLAEVLVGLGFADVTRPEGLSARGELEWSRRSCGHWGTGITNRGQDIDGDGQALRDGDVRWFYDRHRLVKGTVYYSGMNGGWKMIVGGELRSVWHTYLFTATPSTPKRWVRPERRIARLQSEKRTAISAENFERAAVLRDILKQANG